MVSVVSSLCVILRNQSIRPTRQIDVQLFVYKCMECTKRGKERAKKTKTMLQKTRLKHSSETLENNRLFELRGKNSLTKTKKKGGGGRRHYHHWDCFHFTHCHRI